MKTDSSPVKVFRLYLWALAIAVALALLTHVPLGWPSYLSQYAWANLAFFAILSLVGLIWMFAGIMRRKNNFFLLAFVSVFMVDLFGAVIFFLLANRFFEIEKLWFFAPFATYYILFTTVKVLILVRLGDQMKPHGEG